MNIEDIKFRIDELLQLRDKLTYSETRESCFGDTQQSITLEYQDKFQNAYHDLMTCLDNFDQACKDLRNLLSE